MIDFNPLTGQLDDKGLGTTTLNTNYVNVTGDTMTGNLTMNGTNPPQIITGTDKDLALMPHGIGNVGINSTDPDEKLTVVGNFAVKDAENSTKSYRFRTSGSDLDVDGAGKKMWFSVYNSAQYQGTQRFYLALNNSSTDADAFGNWRFQSAPFGSNRLTILSSGPMTVNEALADYDFRVSGDTDTNNLFSDASTDRIGIGTATPTTKLDINGGVVIRGTSTNAPATPIAALELTFGRDNGGGLTSGGTTSDVAFQWGGSGGGYRHWVRSRHLSGDGNGNALDLYINNGGSAGSSSAPGTGNKKVLSLLGLETVINEDSVDYDFRVESDGDANNFFSDGGTNRVGIGTNAPTAKLDVNSDVLRLRTAKTPANAGDTGNAGDICWDASYIYVCTATNTWKRVAIATW